MVAGSFSSSPLTGPTVRGSGSVPHSPCCSSVGTLVTIWRGRHRPVPDVGAARWARMPDRLGVRLVLVAGSAVVGGVPLLAGALAGTVLRTRPRSRLLVAGGCVAAGGIITAVAMATGQGHLSGSADLVAGVGVGLFVAALPVPADAAISDAEESR